MGVLAKIHYKIYYKKIKMIIIKKLLCEIDYYRDELRALYGYLGDIDFSKIEINDRHNLLKDCFSIRERYFSLCDFMASKYSQKL